MGGELERLGRHQACSCAPAATRRDGIPKGAVRCSNCWCPRRSGHVGFFHSLKEGNKIVLLGGNQSGKVCLRAFPRGKLVAIRWLADAPKTSTPVDDTPVTAVAVR